MKLRLRLSVFTAALAAGVIVHAAESLRIVPIVHDKEVFVSVEVPDVYNNDLRDAIASGLRTTCTYDVELRMIVPAWLDRTIVTSVVGISDQYDNLTRRHSLTRTVDGRVEEATVTEDEAVVKRWLTTLTWLPLCRTSKLEPTREYFVRIRARVQPHQASLFSFSRALTGQTRFTFLP